MARWDVHTRKGRAALDKAVAAALKEREGQQRGDVAAKVGAPDRWVSASLARLVRADVAGRSGEKHAPRYWRKGGGDGE